MVRKYKELIKIQFGTQIQYVKRNIEKKKWKNRLESVLRHDKFRNLEKSIYKYLNEKN